MKYIKALYLDSNFVALFLTLVNLFLKEFSIFTGPSAGVKTSFIILALAVVIVVRAFKGNLGKLATAGIFIYI